MKNSYSFLTNELRKIKEQENYHLIFNFTLFLCGITFCYFRLHILAVVFAVLTFKNATRFVVFTLGFITMLIDFGVYNQHLITENHNNIQIEATLESISHKEKTVKYSLSNVKDVNGNVVIDGKIMAYCKRCNETLQPNTQIQGVINIFPLPEKVYPTGYDIQNKYRFLGYSGFGFMDDITQATPNLLNTSPPSQTFFTITTQIRTHLLEKVQTFAKTHNLDNAPLSIVEAVFLGETSRISSETNDLLRATGLTHIISISGFHISIVALLVYAFLMRTLCFCSPLRRKINLKIPSTAIALAFSFGYLAIAGMPIPGIRSFIMITFGAIVVFCGVKPKCLSSVIFSGFVLLSIYPHALFFASFQLSFLAILTLAMIVDDSWKVKNIFMRYCYGIIKSSFAITLVTMPVVLYHFGSISLVNPFVNIVAIPLFTFIIMPIGILFFILTITPLSLSPLNIFLGKAMFESISKMLAGSGYISNFEYSFVALKEIPLESVMLILSGILLMFLIKTILKITGLILCIVGLSIFIYSKTPDIIANENSFVFRNEGKYYVIQQKEQEFVNSVWRGKLGLKKDFLDGKQFCDENGVCIGERVTYIQKNTNLENAKFLKCTDILASHESVSVESLPCKYKLVLTKNALTEKSFVVLKYNEIWG